MPTLLTCLKQSVVPGAYAAGFKLADEVAAEDHAWLEFRRDEARGPVLLNVSVATDEGMLMAELWRPRQLAALQRAGTLERAAERRVVWHYSPERDPTELARDFGRATVDLLAAGRPASIAR